MRLIEIEATVLRGYTQFNSLFFSNRSDQVIQDTKKMKTTLNARIEAEAKEAINRLDLHHFSSLSRRNLVEMDQVRIDMEISHKRKGRRYANVQVQLNTHKRDASDRTTIAIVLIETNEKNKICFSLQRIKEALLLSLKDKVKVTLCSVGKTKN